MVYVVLAEWSTRCSGGSERAPCIDDMEVLAIFFRRGRGVWGTVKASPPLTRFEPGDPADLRDLLDLPQPISPSGPLHQRRGRPVRTQAYPGVGQEAMGGRGGRGRWAFALLAALAVIAQLGGSASSRRRLDGVLGLDDLLKQAGVYSGGAATARQHGRINEFRTFSKPCDPGCTKARAFCMGIM